MSVPAINITPDPWLERCKSFPLGLPEACLWLGAAYTLPLYLSEFLVANGATQPAGWPTNSFPLCIRCVLTLVFLVYFFLVRRGRVLDLGLSTKRLGADLVWGVAASLAVGALYLAGLFVIYLSMVWCFGNSQEFWAQLRRMPMAELSLPHILAVCVAAPLFEELWFRALMYPPMRLHMGRVFAILFLSAIFGAAHSWPPITQTLGGLAFAYAYEKRQTIYASIILHIAGNGILFVIGWAMREGLIKF